MNNDQKIRIDLGQNGVIEAQGWLAVSLGTLLALVIIIGGFLLVVPS